MTTQDFIQAVRDTRDLAFYGSVDAGNRFNPGWAIETCDSFLAEHDKPSPQ